MSNLFYCTVKITRNNETIVFKSSEHAYQYFKAVIVGEPDKAKKILESSSSMSAKEIGNTVKAPMGHIWHTLEKTVLRDIVIQKFAQNKPLLIDLLRTLPLSLIEATKGAKWGGGFEFRSSAYDKGQMTGGNEFGTMLTEIRNNFAIEFGMLSEIWG